MRKSMAYVPATLGWLMLMTVLLMSGIRIFGLNHESYFRLQQRAGVTETAGISQEDMRALDENLAAYLSGRIESPNAEIKVYGKLQNAFNERETAHLADCRRLFAPVCSIPGNVVLLLAGAALVLCGGRVKFAPLPAWTAALLLLSPLFVLGIWAAVDFRSAFAFFHRLLFSNDLWLLNPETDLLIRICPASMFASLGMRIGLYSAGVIAGIPALLTLCNKIADKRKRI